MCGICGKIQFDGEARVEPELIERMMGTISHRGPDGCGKYVSGPVGLGHTRLAIIDLNTGAQPICNEDQTVWIVFNGEIYNYPQLREELLKRGHQFRSTTDTEVIIHLYEEYGAASLSRLQGMFAFAIWDEKDRTLFLARDRVGIKPLYYVNTGKALVFASEIKALLADPEVKCAADPQAVDKFLTHLCLPGRDTLWKGIRKLEPGYSLTAKGGRFKVERYWDLQFHGANGWHSLAQAKEALYSLIKRTVREHMISDVPVGFLLSGGVDSTIVLSCAAKETSQKISTFTVGFDSAVIADERPYARLAAKQFGTDHHEISVSPADFWDFLPTFVRHMEEPVCDPPAVALHYVSKLARNHVKVLLSGEGGDEAFGGYHTYRNFMALEQLKSAGGAVRGVLAAACKTASRTRRLRKISQFAPYLERALPDYYYSRQASPFSYFNRNKPELYAPELLAAVRAEHSTEIIRELFANVRNEPVLNQMQYLDTKTSLPDDLLIKADKMTMVNSLELRVPFLDHVVLEFAASLPPAYRVKGLTTKRILKETFREHIPREIIERKKAGFPIPIERWIERELRDQVQEVLLSRRFLDRGYFRRSGVAKLLALGDQGQPVTKEIFSLLTLELLHREFADR